MCSCGPHRGGPGLSSQAPPAAWNHKLLTVRACFPGPTSTGSSRCARRQRAPLLAQPQALEVCRWHGQGSDGSPLPPLCTAQEQPGSGTLTPRLLSGNAGRRPSDCLSVLPTQGRVPQSRRECTVDRGGSKSHRVSARVRGLAGQRRPTVCRNGADQPHQANPHSEGQLSRVLGTGGQGEGCPCVTLGPLSLGGTSFPSCPLDHSPGKWCGPGDGPAHRQGAQHKLTLHLSDFPSRVGRANTEAGSPWASQARARVPAPCPSQLTAHPPCEPQSPLVSHPKS